jgi:hypothetical protein
VIVDTNVCCADLSSWGTGAPRRAEIVDRIIEEITPANQVVRRWDTFAHINPAVEASPEWRQQVLNGGQPYDVFHANSLSYANGRLLVSYRELDAVYDIDWSNGSILWKIGGHTDPQSLTVVNDPVFSGGGPFATLCGQHDARDLGDGTITIHDNGTNCSTHCEPHHVCGRPPRAVHYAIDTTARTATLVSSVSDPMAPTSGCCGSARLLTGGDWVADWGEPNDFFTELTSSGQRVYLVKFSQHGLWAYRATPILPGVLTAAELRGAMDTQYPRTPTSVSAPSVTGVPVVGHRLTASHGTWSGTDPISYSYRWQRCEAGCVDIAGADKRKLVLTPSDAGAKIRVIVSAADRAGQARAASPKVGPVRH